MSKLLVIFGATGQQGGSVLRTVLDDPELSKTYRIRAITRDTSTPAADALRQEVEVEQADYGDVESLNRALTGAHTVFTMSPAAYGPEAFATEYEGGKNVADAAVAQGVQYIIFSTLPSVRDNSHGQYTKVAGFDAKAEVEKYIRTLPIASAFFAPGSFMQNWHSNMKPRPGPDGTFVVARHVSPQTRLPLIDTADDTGKYVGAILAEPDRYQGKTFCAATALYTLDEIVQIISKSTGKTVTYQQIPEDEFRKYLPPWGDMLVEMMSYQQDFGYYGPDTTDRVAWAARHARGKVHTFEEYLAAHPLELA